MRIPLLDLPPNRTRRNYLGGMLLDRLEGKETCEDDDRPEDWIASTVEARNPGMTPMPMEGLSKVQGDDGEIHMLRDLLQAEMEYYLGGHGEESAEQEKPSLGFLVKFLDSAMRLHVQAHPTSEYARRVLGAPHGKLEFYYIMETRPAIQPAIRLGFQHPPTKSEFIRVVKEQDIAAMDAWFEPIPVQPGEAWLVPGGIPHAIGAGILLVEVMEPSDLVVRLEFERNGIVVPPGARFMGRGVEFAADLMNFRRITVNEVMDQFRLVPKVSRDDDIHREEILIDGSMNDCFCVTKHSIFVRLTVEKGKYPALLVILAGGGRIHAGGMELPIRLASKLFIPAAITSFSIIPSDGPVILLNIHPAN